MRRAGRSSCGGRAPRGRRARTPRTARARAGPRRDPSGAMMAAGALRRDVLVQAEHVVRVVATLQLDEAAMVLRVGRLDPLGAVVPEEVDVRRALAGGLEPPERVPGPGHVGVVVGRIRPCGENVEDEGGI